MDSWRSVPLLHRKNEVVPPQLQSQVPFPFPTNHASNGRHAGRPLGFAVVTDSYTGMGNNGVTVTKFLKFLMIFKMYLELSYNYRYFELRNLGTLVTSVTVTVIKIWHKKYLSSS